MTTRKRSYTWAITPSITLLLLFAGFQYTRGQQDQKAKICEEKINSVQKEQTDSIKEQAKVNAKVLDVLNQIKIELAGVKTEMEYISGRKKVK